MKIFYAIQATGNGHISRAMELLPYLKEFGEIDIFLSGNNSQLELEAPVKFRSKGLSLFYNCSGGLDYWQMMREARPMRIMQEMRDLPVEKYDLVINDFDYITAASCARKRVASVNFGHQASFMSDNTPRPEKKSKAGEYILKNYAKATNYVGLHFKPYDRFIFTPVIKKEIREAQPVDLNYVTVYLPSFCENQLIEIFGQFPEVNFDIFSRDTRTVRRHKNILFMPVTRERFNQSLIYCTGIITGGGFETPAEALHLGKKIMTIPIRSQYEQQCNAAALAQLGVMHLQSIDHDFPRHFSAWMNEAEVPRMDYTHSITDSLNYLMTKVEARELVLND